MDDHETREFLRELEKEDLQEEDNEALVPAGQRPCPICKEIMQVETEHGIEVDVCPSHGVWLDRRELRRIASRVLSGEKLSRIAAIDRAKRQGKLSGAVFGLWSLWVD